MAQCIMSIHLCRGRRTGCNVADLKKTGKGVVKVRFGEKRERGDTKMERLIDEFEALAQAQRIVFDVDELSKSICRSQLVLHR